MKHPIVPYHSEWHEITFIQDRMVKSQVIYIAFMIMILIFIVSLPLIRISVSVQNRGIIRPVSEITEIRVIPSAPVSAVYIYEGQKVEAGDTLIVLESEGIQSKIDFIRTELHETENYITDLQNLTLQTPVNHFQSDLYSTQNINYSKKAAEIDFRIERANLEVVRQRPLFDNHLISEKEFEELVNSREQLENERKVMEASQRLQWRSELAKYCSCRAGYISQVDQLEKELQLYVIKSPVKGTIESFTGIYPGCNIGSGQVVAVISPENSLIAEVFVTAKNIGLLYNGMPVKIQIDAFNYNEWGTINGQISRISDDYSLLNDIPVFKVQCTLYSTGLALKNGTPGRIKKGMTVNARFMIAKRSLFQLMYQKTDDWLNPSRNLTERQ